MKVYTAINQVQHELSRRGITKDNLNQQQGYKFRGIDDVYNALSPLLAKHGLCILPRILSRDCQERVNSRGNALFYVTVEAEFDFVCAEDGSKHVVRTFGEAMDSGDKATNKAMSAAYKYAAFQAFAIPTEGDNDADAQTHEPVARITPAGGVWDALDAETQTKLEQVVITVNEYMEADDPTGANEYLHRTGLTADEKVAVWSRLDSKTRTALKKATKEAA